MSELQEMTGLIEREREAALSRIAEAATTAALQEAETSALGRKAAMSDLKRRLGGLGEEDRRTIGRLLNDARDAIEAALSERSAVLAAHEEEASLESDRADVTLPGRTRARGHPNPVSLVMDRIVDIFIGMGYRVAEGPEAETDLYNFEALNIPPDHPARSMHDTLYLEGSDALLRTHTSPVQIRAMQKVAPAPIYVVVPGRVFRRDPFDPTHSPVFNQIEGLAVDTGISLADLKGTITEFVRQLFGSEQRVRFRPSYFPFTEPSAEADMSCPTCGGTGCSACGHSGWLEIMGAGMVHPTVLHAGGFDPHRVSGFAFGMGPDRIAMRLFGIGDIRSFWENDMRFLSGFAG